MTHMSPSPCAASVACPSTLRSHTLTLSHTLPPPVAHPSHSLSHTLQSHTHYCTLFHTVTLHSTYHCTPLHAHCHTPSSQSRLHSDPQPSPSWRNLPASGQQGVGSSCGPLLCVTGACTSDLIGSWRSVCFGAGQPLSGELSKAPGIQVQDDTGPSAAGNSSALTISSGWGHTVSSKPIHPPCLS